MSTCNRCLLFLFTGTGTWKEQPGFLFSGRTELRIPFVNTMILINNSASQPTKVNCKFTLECKNVSTLFFKKYYSICQFL